VPEGEGHETKPDKSQQDEHQTGDLAAGDAGTTCVTGQTNPPRQGSRAGRRPTSHGVVWAAKWMWHKPAAG